MPDRPFAWEKSYPAGVRWDVPNVPGTLTSMFDDATARYADRTVIEYRDHTISFAALRQEVDRAAAALMRAGVGPDASLALYLPNCPYHPFGFFAGLKAGARITHLSPLDAERELAHKLTDSGARTLVTTNVGGLLSKALKLLEGGYVDRVIVGDDAAFGASPAAVLPLPAGQGVVPWDVFVQDGLPPAQWPRIGPADAAVLQYTGGTTGLPKGATLTHANLTSTQAIYDAWQGGQGQIRDTREKVICVLPLFHVYALTTILLRQIYLGNEIMLRPRFDVATTLHDIEVKRATIFNGVPTMWIALTNHPDIETRDFSSLVRCSSGGAPLPIEVAERFERLTGHSLRGGWGMTETCSPGSTLPAKGPVPAGSVGLPLPGIEMEVVALDNPRRRLPPGETGEIRVRGPNVTAGYWNRPEETAAAFVDGYFLTGDIGYMDSAGFFFLVDRKKDMIISGGFNVYPQMIEQAIYEHGQVEEVLVVGVPERYRGEAAKAFVKLRTGAAGFSLEELQAFLADKLGRHEMPSALEFRASLPRTPVGKLSKIELRDEERRKHQEQIRQSA
jgi:long-chain acyl-CoA synthetase